MITSNQISIGLTPIAIDGVWQNPSRITIHNIDSNSPLYLGNETVTITTGLALQKLETLQFDLQPLEQIWAVSDKPDHKIAWMRQTI